MNTLAAKTNPSALRTLPKGIDDTYAEAKERIDDQNEDYQQLATRALSWVFHAVRPTSDPDNHWQPLMTDDYPCWQRRQPGGVMYIVHVMYKTSWTMSEKRSPFDQHIRKPDNIYLAIMQYI